MIAVLSSDQHHNLLNDPYGLKDHKERALRTMLDATLKADVGIDTGDLFNYRNPSSSTVNWVSAIYGDVLGREIYKQYFCIGNHGDDNRESSPIEAFVNGCKCFGKAPVIIGKDLVIRDTLAIRGWQSNDPIKFPDYIEYFVTHARIAEWIFGNKERAFNKVEFESLNVKRILLGDSHQRRDEGRLVSIGTLCPKDFGDKDVQAGFIVLDTDHNEYKRVDIEGYPIFRTIEIYENVKFEPKPEYVKGNIIKLKFIGSSKFVQDKTIKQKWLQTIWAMQPHYLEDDFEQTAPEIAVPASQISIEEEIKQAAIEQKWPEGTDDIAINEVTR